MSAFSLNWGLVRASVAQVKYKSGVLAVVDTTNNVHAVNPLPEPISTPD